MGTRSRVLDTPGAATLGCARLALENPTGTAERARRVLDELEAVVGVLSPDGIVIELNPAALRHGGWTRADVVGRPLWELGAWFSEPEERAAARRACRRAQRGLPARCEVRLRADAVLELRLRLLPGGDRGRRMVLLEGTDVTERRALEERARRRERELAAIADRERLAAAARRGLIADVTHELKTPLRIALELVDRMLERAVLPPATRRDAEALRANARALLAGVEDLIAAARLEAAHPTVRLRDADLAELARRVAGRFEPIVEGRGVRLSVRAPDRLPVRIDPERMMSAMANLLANALRFTPTEGAIRITVIEHGPGVRLEVADSGPGVPAAERGAVLERFRQSSASAARGEGSGVGLALVREAARAHGGTVRVERAPEGGALVAMEMPLTRVERGPAPRTAAEDVAGAWVERLAHEPAATAPGDGAPTELPGLLVVHGDRVAAARLCDVFADGYEVEVADAGKALERLATWTPDVVVGDLAAAGPSGEELLAVLRRAERFDDVALVVTGGARRIASRARLLRQGADDVLAPWAGPAELRARVDLLVVRRRQVLARRRESEGHAALLRVASVPLGLLAADGGWLYANRALCALLGRSERELHRLTLDDVVLAADGAGGRGQLAELWSGRTRGVRLRCRLLRPDREALDAVLALRLATPPGAHEPCAAVEVEAGRGEGPN
jgi:PAS domain S-box-containing protein